MGRKRSKNKSRDDSQGADRPANTAHAPKVMPAQPTPAPPVATQPAAAAAQTDIALPPWLAAWLALHGAATAVCGTIVLLVAIVFGQTLRHDFIDWDDAEYIVNNRHVHDGLSVQGIVWAFTNRDEANWHPLTWISHMLDWQLYGS